jgi:hypothetical protein
LTGREDTRLQERSASAGGSLEQSVPGITGTPDGEFARYLVAGMDRYSPLFEESLTLSDFLKNIQMVCDQFLQFLLTLFESIRERTGAQLKAYTDPLASFLLEAEGKGDIS